MLATRHVLIARVKTRRTRPRQRRHSVADKATTRSQRRRTHIQKKKNRLRSFQTSEPMSMCPGAHGHMPMEANNPTESNDYATPTNPCHARPTENRSGQNQTSRGQIRADRDNPPLSLGAFSSSVTSTCKKRSLHLNLTYTKLNMHGAQHSRNY